MRCPALFFYSTVLLFKKKISYTMLIAVSYSGLQYVLCREIIVFLCEIAQAICVLRSFKANTISGNHYARLGLQERIHQRYLGIRLSDVEAQQECDITEQELARLKVED